VLAALARFGEQRPQSLGELTVVDQTPSRVASTFPDTSQVSQVPVRIFLPGIQLKCAMHVRPEREGEFPKIYALVKSAFQTSRYAEGDEHDFVDRLRHGGDYVPALSLVVEDDARLVAHIMATRTRVLTHERPYPALLLAVVSVVQDRRGQGIGAGLIKELIDRACDAGHQALFVVGDPSYYARDPGLAGLWLSAIHPIWNSRRT